MGKKLEFLCSVANDCYRIINSHIPSLRKKLVARSGDQLNGNGNGERESENGNGNGSGTGGAVQADESDEFLHSYVDVDVDMTIGRVVSDLTYVAWTAIETIVKMIFSDLDNVFIVQFDKQWENNIYATDMTGGGGIEKPATPLQTVLKTVEDYLQDMKMALYPPYFHMLVLSCGHKIIQR
jgi:hypothetical protein